MEEDVENFSSVAGDILAKARGIIFLDEMNFSTKQSQLLANILDGVTIDDEDQSVFFQWYFDLCAWIAIKFAETNYYYLKTPLELVKRDDRLTSFTCYVAIMSFRKVLEKFAPEVSYANNDNSRRSMQAIQEEVLDSFDFFWKDLLIEESWNVVSIRQCIVEAAKFAIDYINSSQVKNLFSGKDEHLDNLFWIFEDFLKGNFKQDEEFLLKKNVSTNVMTNDIVGLSVDIEKIKDRLRGSHLKLDFIPIIGMGGIGKTTLARKVYEDPQIFPLFHVRAWIVVSHEFQERDVVLALLESIAPLPSEVYNEDTIQLVERLYRRLKGWRYFIVIDDIWTKEAWNCIKLCFPNNLNGSRIILTSRVTEVACHDNLDNPPHFMSFLCVEDSWELLQKRICMKENFSQELMNIGMKIAKNAKDCPLQLK